eukprot:7649419-Alexandrium_andersonii.AAC.1
MSASLVGSEMCIRDRLSRTRASRCDGLRGSFRTDSGDDRCLGRGWNSICLLYTSDAADDM